MYHPYLTEPIFIELFRNRKSEESKGQIPHLSACAEVQYDYFQPLPLSVLLRLLFPVALEWNEAES